MTTENIVQSNHSHSPFITGIGFALATGLLLGVAIKGIVVKSTMTPAEKKLRQLEHGIALQKKAAKNKKASFDKRAKAVRKKAKAYAKGK